MKRFGMTVLLTLALFSPTFAQDGDATRGQRGTSGLARHVIRSNPTAT